MQISLGKPSAGRGSAAGPGLAQPAAEGSELPALNRHHHSHVIFKSSARRSPPSLGDLARARGAGGSAGTPVPKPAGLEGGGTGGGQPTGGHGVKLGAEPGTSPRRPAAPEAIRRAGSTSPQLGCICNRRVYVNIFSCCIYTAASRARAPLVPAESTLGPFGSQAPRHRGQERREDRRSLLLPSCPGLHCSPPLPNASHRFCTEGRRQPEPQSHRKPLIRGCLNLTLTARPKPSPYFLITVIC